MARLRLVPQTREFFSLYAQASANVIDIARLLGELLDAFPEQDARIARAIKDREHDGDRLTHEIVLLLNRTFVTPFDRDDMYRLAGVIDDVCDLIDEAADNIELYGVKVIPPEAKEQARVVLECATVLDEVIRRLDGFHESDQQLARLRELEDEGDRIVRGAVAGLFRSDQDPISIIRWKDIHEQLEEAVDACQTAADVLEAILVKNR